MGSCKRKSDRKERIEEKKTRKEEEREKKKKRCTVSRLRSAATQYLLGELTGLVGRVEDLVEEDREVEGKA